MVCVLKRKEKIVIADCGSIAEVHHLAKVWGGMSNIQFWTAAQMAEFYTCDIK
jgi:hypothetical protein